MRIHKSLFLNILAAIFLISPFFVTYGQRIEQEDNETPIKIRYEKTKEPARVFDIIDEGYFEGNFELVNSGYNNKVFEIHRDSIYCIEIQQQGLENHWFSVALQESIEGTNPSDIPVTDVYRISYKNPEDEKINKTLEPHFYDTIDINWWEKAKENGTYLDCDRNNKGEDEGVVQFGMDLNNHYEKDTEYDGGRCKVEVGESTETDTSFGFSIPDRCFKNINTSGAYIKHITPSENLPNFDKQKVSEVVEFFDTTNRLITKITAPEVEEDTTYTLNFTAHFCVGEIEGTTEQEHNNCSTEDDETQETVTQEGIVEIKVLNRDPCASGCGCGDPYCSASSVVTCECEENENENSCKKVEKPDPPCDNGCSEGVCNLYPERPPEPGSGGIPHPENRNIDFEITYCTEGGSCAICDEYGFGPNKEDTCPEKTEVDEVRVKAKDGTVDTSYWRVFTVKGGTTCPIFGETLFGEDTTRWGSIGLDINAFTTSSGVSEVGRVNGSVQSRYREDNDVIIVNSKTYNNATLCFASKLKPGQDFDTDGIDQDIEYGWPTLPLIDVIKTFTITSDKIVAAAPGLQQQEQEKEKFELCGTVDKDAKITEIEVYGGVITGGRIQRIITEVTVQTLASSAIQVKYTPQGTKVKEWCVYTDIVSVEERIGEVETKLEVIVYAENAKGVIKKVSRHPVTVNGDGSITVPDENELITPPTTCENKVKDENETGIDCGGPCPACDSTENDDDDDDDDDDDNNLPANCNGTSCTLGNLRDISGGGDRKLVEIPKQKESGLIIPCSFGEEKRNEKTGKLLPGSKENCGIKHLFQLANNIMKLLLWLAIIGAGVVIFWKGAKLATNIYWPGGYDTARSEFQEALKVILIGLAIILGAYAIVQTGFNIVGYDEDELGDPFVFDPQKTKIENLQPSDTGGEGSGSGGGTPNPTRPPNNGGPAPTDAEKDECEKHSRKEIDKPCECSNCEILSEGSGIECKDNCKATRSLADNLKTLKASSSSPWRVTEGWPPTVRHASSCHYNGTCVDINFYSNGRSDHGPADSADVKDFEDFKIKVEAFIADAKNAGLCAVYEIPDATSFCNSRGFSTLRKNFTDNNREIQFFTVSCPHFSVYLPDKCPY